MQSKSSPPELRVSMKKTGSWLERSRSRTRSGSRPKIGIKKQRSLTNVISSMQRVSSLKRMKNATAQKKGRQEADGRHHSRESDEHNVPTSTSLLDDDDNDFDKENLNEENLDCGNGWHFIDTDRSLHSLSLFEAAFIDNTITKLHMHGYEHRGVDVYSLGALLREIIVWEKPFDSLQESLDSLVDEEAMSRARRRPKFNVDIFLTSLEHTLPLDCTTSSGNALGTAPMTPNQMNRVVCSVLEEMNVKVTKDGSGKGGGGAKQRSGARGNPLFTRSWISLTSCYCGLY